MHKPHDFPGFLIAIEGIDGSGKTTQVRLLQEVLQARNLTVLTTKEPTTGRWGQMLRDSAVTGRLSLDEEVEAFVKDRQEHVETRIAPALSQGSVVIVDRYYFSTAAYQGARGLDPDELIRRNETFAPEPDLLVLLDIVPDAGLERIRLRGDKANLFENTGNLERARAIFRNIRKPYLIRIDATQTVEEVTNIIIRQFAGLYVEKIARSLREPREKLNLILGLFGKNPA